MEEEDKRDISTKDIYLWLLNCVVDMSVKRGSVIPVTGTLAF